MQRAGGRSCGRTRVRVGVVGMKHTHLLKKYDNTHKTSMNGGPSWKDVKYRITTDLDQNLILSKERVLHDAQYDWHSVLPGNVRRNIRTDLYSYIDLDEDDGFSICS